MALSNEGPGQMETDASSSTGDQDEYKIYLLVQNLLAYQYFANLFLAGSVRAINCTCSPR